MRTLGWLALSAVLLHQAYDLHMRAVTMTDSAIGGIPTTATPRAQADPPKRPGAYFGKDVRENVKRPENQAKLAQARETDAHAVWYLSGSALALLIALAPFILKLKEKIRAQSLPAHSARDPGCGRAVHVAPTDAVGGLRADGGGEDGRPPA